MKLKGKIKDGQIIVDDKKRFDQETERLEGDVIWLEVCKWFNRRSNKQVRYYWGVVVQMLSEETGYTDDEIHELLKVKFLPKKEILGENINTSTTVLDTKEMEEYMKKIRMWASVKLTTYIPEPNEAPGFSYEV